MAAKTPEEMFAEVKAFYEPRYRKALKGGFRSDLPFEKVEELHKKMKQMEKEMDVFYSVRPVLAENFVRYSTEKTS